MASVWSRVRHRRLQALSLFTLAALLATSVCLGPLYQRAMQQALAASVIANASPADRAVRITSIERSASELEGLLPDSVAPYFAEPSVAMDVPISVRPPTGASNIATRLHAVEGACQELEVVTGRCPDASGEVMVSTVDAELNGWAVSSQVPFAERLDPVLFDEEGEGELTVVGVYQPPEGDDWLDAPLTGRAGTLVPDIGGVATDDWVTSPETITTAPPVDWQQIFGSVLWSLDTDAVGHDELLQVGPVIDRIQRGAEASSGDVDVVVNHRPAGDGRAGRHRRRPGPDDGRGPGRAAAGPGGSGPLDGAGCGHR